MIIRSIDVSSLMVDDKPASSYIPKSDTVLLNGERWSILTVNVSPGSHLIVSAKNTLYTVIAFGFSRNSAYGFPLDMKLN